LGPPQPYGRTPGACSEADWWPRGDRIACRTLRYGIGPVNAHSAPGPKLPTRCAGRCSPGFCQAFKQGGCARPVPPYIGPSRGVAARPVSKSVSIGLRSRLVVDACGAPVLRDRDGIGLPFPVGRFLPWEGLEGGPLVGPGGLDRGSRFRVTASRPRSPMSWRGTVRACHRNGRSSFRSRLRKVRLW
jgi:hypothetical protein